MDDLLKPWLSRYYQASHGMGEESKSVVAEEFKAAMEKDEALKNAAKAYKLSPNDKLCNPRRDYIRSIHNDLLVRTL